VASTILEAGRLARRVEGELMAKSFRSVSITSGQSLSDAVDLSGYDVVGVSLPSAWTAANLTFQGSIDGSTYTNLIEKAGVELEIIAAANYLIPLSSSAFAPLRFLKIRSGTSTTPVNQSANRTIQLILEGN